MADPISPELLAAYREALSETSRAPIAAPDVPTSVPAAPAAAAAAPGGDMVSKFLAGASPQTHAAIQDFHDGPNGNDPDQRVRDLLAKQYPPGMSAKDITAKLAADKAAVGKSVGPGETFLSQFANSAGLGFGDEAGAATQRAYDMVTGTPSSYTAIRDNMRARREAGSAQHRGASIAGDLAGGALLGAMIPVPSTLGRATALGAGFGAASGAGNSDADIDSTQFAGDVVKGAGIGGMAGAAGYKLTKYINDAPERQTDATMRKIVGRGGEGAQKEADAVQDSVLYALKEHPEVKSTVGQPKETIRTAETAIAGRSAGNTSIYDGATEVSAKAAEKSAQAEAARLQSLAEEAEHEAEKKAGTIPAIQKAIERHSKNADKYVNPDLNARAAMNASKREIELAETQAAIDAAKEQAASLRAQAQAAIENGAAGGGVATDAIKDAISKSGVPGRDHGPAIAKFGKALDELAGGRSRIPAREVRDWITDYLGPNTMPSAETTTEQAKQGARIAARDVLTKHVADTLGEDAAKQVADNNRAITGLSTIRDIAETNARKGRYRPEDLQGQGFKASTIGKVKHAIGDAATAVAGSAPIQAAGGSAIGNGVACAVAQPAIDLATLRAKAKQTIFGD